MVKCLQFYFQKIFLESQFQPTLTQNYDWLPLSSSCFWNKCILMHILWTIKLFNYFEFEKTSSLNTIQKKCIVHVKDFKNKNTFRSLPEVILKHKIICILLKWSDLNLLKIQSDRNDHWGILKTQAKLKK
jgi:hypothetical protein